MNLKEFQDKCLETSGFATEDSVNKVLAQLAGVECVLAVDDDTSELLEVIGAVADYLIMQIQKDELEHRILGLCGEAGEVAEKYKKVIRNQKGEFASFEEQQIDPGLITNEDIADEILDVMWYCVTTLDLLGCDFQNRAEMLLEKLADRKSRNVIKSSGDHR